MPTRSAFSERRVLIFDTGPLWELVLYSAVYDLNYVRLKSELRHLKEKSHQRKLSAFIAQFHTRTTTPHVVAEISAWIRRTAEERSHASIWGIVYREFTSMEMDEDILKLLDMPQALVSDMGAVDASVLQLGLKFAQSRPHILTVDNALRAECERNRINAVDLWQVIAEDYF